MPRHAEISSRFVQSKESTTPIGVNHVPKNDAQEVHGMFAEHAWSTFLRLKIIIARL